jgi:hypothetical protein
MIVRLKRDQLLEYPMTTTTRYVSLEMMIWQGWKVGEESFLWPLRRLQIGFVAEIENLIVRAMV